MSKFRTKNKHEIKVKAQLDAAGWQVLKRGWPDFLAIRGDEVRLIEVKSRDPNAHLKPDQLAMAHALLKAGVTVELAHGTLEDCSDFRDSLIPSGKKAGEPTEG